VAKKRNGIGFKGVQVPLTGPHSGCSRV
jgi:hypothetical protein